MISPNSFGLVLLNLLILLVETIEYSFTNVGIPTGIAILLAIFGGYYLGRPGTTFVTAVNPPIAFFISTVLLIGTVGGAGLHLARFGLDFVTTFGATAPYLIIGTGLGWVNHLWGAKFRALLSRNS